MFRHAQRRGEQLVNLLPRKNEREFFLQLRQLQFSHRIDAQSFSLNEKSIEGAQRRKLQADVGTRLLFLHQRKKVISKIVRRAFFPRADREFAKCAESLSITEDRSRGHIPFDFEEAHELFDQRILFPRALLLFLVIPSAVEESLTIYWRCRRLK